ncbi:MAG TPA: hypothetical protein K8V35_04675 [Aliicoccus persicus]|uniref:Uncharacterized protein n=1 Tax=Aliicoccus persicus TaxID=930138 RepID=A0A921DWW8_9STAP|nr:hypothetical protein [Aliicoccus persicus]
MNNSKYSKWNLSIIALGGLIGISIYQIFNFDLSVFLGGIFGAVLLALVNVILVLTKSDESAEISQKVFQNVRNYYYYVYLVFTAVALIALVVMMSLDIEVVPVSTLFLVFIVYFVLSGIGAFMVAKKKM